MNWVSTPQKLMVFIMSFVIIWVIIAYSLMLNFRNPDSFVTITPN
jgi:hypothetical protein